MCFRFSLFFAFHFFHHFLLIQIPLLFFLVERVELEFFFCSSLNKRKTTMKKTSGTHIPRWVCVCATMQAPSTRYAPVFNLLNCLATLSIASTLRSDAIKMILLLRAIVISLLHETRPSQHVRRTVNTFRVEFKTQRNKLIFYIELHLEEYFSVLFCFRINIKHGYRWSRRRRVEMFAAENLFRKRKIPSLWRHCKSYFFQFEATVQTTEIPDIMLCTFVG